MLTHYPFSVQAKPRARPSCAARDESQCPIHLRTRACHRNALSSILCTCFPTLIQAAIISGRERWGTDMAIEMGMGQACRRERGEVGAELEEAGGEVSDQGGEPAASVGETGEEVIEEVDEEGEDAAGNVSEQGEAAASYPCTHARTHAHACPHALSRPDPRPPFPRVIPVSTCSLA